MLLPSLAKSHELFTTTSPAALGRGIPGIVVSDPSDDAEYPSIWFFRCWESC